MAYALTLLSLIHTETLNDGNNLTSLCREAEQMFPAWKNEPDFFGLAVVDRTTGEVVHLVR